MKRFIGAFLLLAAGASAQTSDTNRIDDLTSFHESTGNAEICWETDGRWIFDTAMCNCPAGESFDALPGVGCNPVAPPPPPPQLCPNSVIDSTATPPEVCEPGLLGGEDCPSQGFIGGTLACSADCLSFDTSSCTAAGSMWDGLAPYIPAPGEWALIHNSSPASVFHQLGDFPHSSDIWGNKGPTQAFMAWNGMALDRDNGRWFALRGGGHGAYGGNEVYLFTFPTVTWTRETDPTALSVPGNCMSAPVDGPYSLHTYDSSIYVPSTNEIIVGGNNIYCSNGVPPFGAWVYNVDLKTWRVPSSLEPNEHKDRMMASAYDAARDRVYMTRGTAPGQNRFREIDPQNDYEIVRDMIFIAQNDGPIVFEPTTRILYSVGTEGGGPNKPIKTVLTSVPIALDGTLGTQISVNMTDAFPTTNNESRSLAIHTPSGDLVIWHGLAELTRVAPTFDSAKTLTGGGARVPVAPDPQSDSLIYSKWFYVEELDVFVGINDPNEGIWLYRLPQSDGGDSASTFEQLCAQPGVVLCDPLDTEGPFDGMGNVMPNPDGSHGIPANGRTGNWRGVDGSVRRPELDRSVKASGTGSMRFTIASESDGNDAGEFATNFSDDLSVVFVPGDTVYTHYKWRASCELLYLDCDPASPTYKTKRREYRTTRDGARLKLSIVGTGDVDLAFPAKSCSSLEVVLNHGPDHHLTGYHHCGVNEHFSIRAPGTSNLNFQPGGTYNCYARVNGERRDWGNTGPDCFYLEPDEWITFETKIEIGEWQPRGKREREKLSRITVWAAHEGEPLQVVMQNDFYLHGPHASDFARDKDLTARAGFGKIWPHPFLNAKDPTEVHPEAYIWYDELIVSTRPIKSG